MGTTRFRLIYLLLFLLFATHVHAVVEVRSKQLTIVDGLANNTVRQFMQDSKGFLWFGTLNGLNRYDGNTFLSFSPSQDNSISLADYKVFDLLEDKNGFLWVSFSSELFSCYDLKRACFVDYTGNGEYNQKYSRIFFASNNDVWLWSDDSGARKIVYDKKKESFSSVKYNLENQNLPTNFLNFVTEGNNKIWIGTKKGLLLISEKGENLVDKTSDIQAHCSYQDKDYFFTGNNEILIFEEQSNLLKKVGSSSETQSTLTGNFVIGNQWVLLTSTGVYTYDFSSNRIRSNPAFLGENLLSANVIIDNKQNFWVYNHTGKLYYINATTGVRKTFNTIPSEKLGYIDIERYRIVHDSRDIIWISTYGNGLFAYEIEKDELTHFSTQVSDFNPVGSDYLLSVMEDRSGTIWVSAEFAGIYSLSVINEGAHRYFPENPTSLDRSNTIRMVAHLYDDEIWMGTRQGGLYKYDLDFNLKSSQNNLHSSVYAVEKDLSGKIWYGTRGDGLFIGDAWYKNQPGNPNSIANDVIFCLYRDKAGRMWIGTFGGGLSLAEQTGTSYRFHSFFNESYGQQHIRSICEDRNGMIWVGTNDGIYVFYPDSFLKNPTDYYHYDYAKGNLGSNEVKYLYPDSKGNIWIATSGAGFSICQPEGDYSQLTFEHFSSINGLCNDVVQSMIEDDYGNMWIATEYGISKFTRSNKIFETYYFSSYTQGNVYSESSVCKLKDGKILFGSNYGFIVFDPNEVKKTNYDFPVVFTNLNINGSNIQPGDPDSPLSFSLAYSNEIKLNHNQNSIIVDFSTFNYSEGEQTQYSYFLQGYDKQWTESSPLNFASYKMLPYGKYEFRVKASNSPGVWTDDVSVLKIVIKPPIYLTYWAFLIYAILLAVILYATFRIIRNFNRLHNNIQIEKQFTEYKLVFFTNISHEFRTPLTLIQGSLDRIKQLNIQSKELAYPLKTLDKSTQRLLRLINQLLEFRKMQKNKLALSLEKTDVIAMLYEIFLSFKDMAESKNMDFEFAPSVDSYSMYIDKGKLDKIAYNLLSNAFKYTPSGGKISLFVKIDEVKNELGIEVIDTGVGIPKEKRSELFNRFMQTNFSGDSMGVGLHLTLELVRVHKGKIEYKENPQGGSIFSVALPLREDVYEEQDFLVANNLIHESVRIESEEETLKDIQINIDPLNKQKLLIIEDDIEVRKYLNEELSRYFHIETAEDGLKGFEKAQETSPDLIVCDVMMPGMNGYEVTKKLKGDFETSHIPVILLTALSLPENHMEGIESGADSYLTKPFSTRLLLTRIIKLIEQREKLKEKFSQEPGIVRSAIYVVDRDKEFVDDLHRILEENLGNPAFTMDEFASLMKLGRTVFYKKVKGVTSYSPNEYLRIMRMKKGAELLLSGKYTVAEVSYQVGIEDPFYFSKCFKTQFGISPSGYLRGDQPTKEQP